MGTCGKTHQPFRFNPGIRKGSSCMNDALHLGGAIPVTDPFPTRPFGLALYSSSGEDPPGSPESPWSPQPISWEWMELVGNKQKSSRHFSDSGLRQRCCWHLLALQLSACLRGCHFAQLMRRGFETGGLCETNFARTATVFGTNHASQCIGPK